jgi:hypothetical protein
VIKREPWHGVSFFTVLPSDNEITVVIIIATTTNIATSSAKEQHAGTKTPTSKIRPFADFRVLQTALSVVNPL